MRRLAFVCYFFVSFFFSLNVAAQKDSVKYYLQPSITGTIGVGFSITNLNQANNQEWMDFVKPGLNTSVSGQVPLVHSHFGARASFIYCRNSFDMPRFLKQLDSSAPHSTATSISYGAFTQYALLLGSSYSFYDKKRKTICDIWLQFGAEYLSLPNTEVNMAVSQPAQSNWNSTVVYSANFGFAFDVGSTTSWRLSKKWWLSISVELLYADVAYNDVKYDVYIQHIQYTTPAFGTAHMATESLMAGIRYRL